MTADEALEFATLSSRIQPEQITFILKNVDAKGTVDISLEEFQGSIQLISGQAVDGKILPFPKDVGAIDRDKYPNAWAFSRFSAPSREVVPDLLKSALWTMKRELELRNLPFSEGWVFAHATDEAHTALYERIYKMEVDEVIDASRKETRLKIRAYVLASKWAPELLKSLSESLEAEKLKWGSGDYDFGFNRGSFQWARVAAGDSFELNSSAYQCLRPEWIERIQKWRSENSGKSL